MSETYFRKLDIVLRLNHVNNLALELEENITKTGEMLLVSRDETGDKVKICLAKASECANEARRTLEALEDQIRKTNLAAKHIGRQQREPL